MVRQGGRVELWSGKVGCGEAVQAGRGLLGYGGVRYVRARRSSYGVFRSVKARPVEAVGVRCVSVLLVLVSFVKAV